MIAAHTQLDDILKYEHPDLIDRLIRELDITKLDAVDLFQDVKRFLYLCAEHEPPHCPPPRIDDAWHEFLLYTREYAVFCRQYFGKFIHHMPISKNAPHRDKCGGKRTVAIAKKIFREPLSENWSRAKYSEDPCDGCSGGDSGCCGADGL